MPLDTGKLPRGREQYEGFTSLVRKQELVQYDYRAEDGNLFSCVRPTLEECRAARDAWLAAKGNGKKHGKKVSA